MFRNIWSSSALEIISLGNCCLLLLLTLLMLLMLLMMMTTLVESCSDKLLKRINLIHFYTT
jgi:hypothetical protein